MPKNKDLPGAALEPSAIYAMEAVSADDLHNLNFKTVSDLWLLLRNKGTAIFNACTPNQQPLFQAIRDGARDAYFKAVNSRLEDNNALIAQIRKDLGDTTKQLKATLEDLTQIESALRNLAEAVKLAGSIVTLAAV